MNLILCFSGSITMFPILFDPLFYLCYYTGKFNHVFVKKKYLNQAELFFFSLKTESSKVLTCYVSVKVQV